MTSNNITDNDSSKNFEVLIVDDIPENLQVLANILDKQGMDVSYASSGYEALNSLKAELPDLILLDISMPEMDGYKVCEIIKSNTETRDIPVIFLTARDQTEDIIKGFKIGAVDYITKPFNVEEMTTRILTHLELKHSRDSMAKYIKIIKEKNRQISEQNKQLKDLNATKDKFFSIIAHDLTSPFHTLISISDLLASKFKQFPPEKVERYIHLIQESTKNTYSLLENLLAWSRTQTNKIELFPEYINVQKQVIDSIKLLRGMANRKNISLSYSAADNLVVYADENMLTTILRNLISNALKFTEKNGRVIIKAKNITKKLKNKRITEFVEITVSDTGVGIPEQKMNELFRIDKSRSTCGTENEKGTGLGLVLCKEFVEINGGAITGKSTLGEGSDFIFTLPTEPLTNQTPKNNYQKLHIEA